MTNKITQEESRNKHNEKFNIWYEEQIERAKRSEERQIEKWKKFDKEFQSTLKFTRPTQQKNLFSSIVILYHFLTEHFTKKESTTDETDNTPHIEESQYEKNSVNLIEQIVYFILSLTLLTVFFLAFFYTYANDCEQFSTLYISPDCLIKK
ncbi:MAG: hypothetical protein RI964_1657 [Pseudomonadota bacterium]|jgi:hypothetical protein